MVGGITAVVLTGSGSSIVSIGPGRSTEEVVGRAEVGGTTGGTELVGSGSSTPVDVVETGGAVFVSPGSSSGCADVGADGAGFVGCVTGSGCADEVGADGAGFVGSVTGSGCADVVGADGAGFVGSGSSTWVVEVETGMGGIGSVIPGSSSLVDVVGTEGAGLVGSGSSTSVDVVETEGRGLESVSTGSSPVDVIGSSVGKVNEMTTVELPGRGITIPLGPIRIASELVCEGFSLPLLEVESRMGAGPPVTVVVVTCVIVVTSVELLSFAD